jgi:hypothetical protein
MHHVAFVLSLCSAACVSLSAHAQAPETPAPKPAEQSLGVVQNAVATAAESREDRGKTPYTVLASYSYFDTWVPSKWGVAGVYNLSASEAFELGYSRGTVGFDYFHVSIGKISDDRFYLVWRHFGRFNSLNFILGVHHEAFRAKLGNDLMRTVSGHNSSVELLELTTFGPTFGIGNRWQTRGGFVWSFDWLAVHIPLWALRTRAPFLDATSSSSSRKNVEDVLKAMRDIPTGAVVKVQLGYAF